MRPLRPSRSGPDFRVARAETERRVLRHFGAYVGKSDAVRGAGDAPNGLLVEHELVAGRRLALDVEHAQAPVHLAAVVLTSNGLLPRIAALLEVDVRLFEARLSGQHTVVE